MPETYLKVDSAYPEDQGGGKARLDPETMNQLRVSPGDIVLIEGKRRTVAKVWRALVTDWNQGKIRIDNITRANAGVSLGDRIRVAKLTEEIEARRVVLAPPVDLPSNMPINLDHAISSLIDFPVVEGDSVPIRQGFPFMQPQIVAFKAITVEPEEAVIISKNTEIEFSDKPAAGFEGARQISYEDIGGLNYELQRVRETIELPIRHPELFRRLGIEPPKGVLLYGPPGTGKTLIAKAVANESGAHFIAIAGPEVISKYYGESEQRLREVFEEARENAPAIIFIDELDSIAPKREDVTGEVERRVVAQLLTMMDGLEERGEVVVIGATNRVDAIDPALRRPGRFDREIEIGVPAEKDRIEILKIHTRTMPLGDEVDLDRMAAQTYGFVGADLAALAREAGIRALRRKLPDFDLEKDELSEEELESLLVESRDFRDALRDVTPSAMREIMLEVSHVTWSDVGGLDEAKKDIRELVEYPLKEPGRFDLLGIRPPRGVLLYGPPGTGKTLIAKAATSESGANFIPIRGPQLLSKWVGESEKAVREIFRKARQVAPSIIFFDELDALAPSRGMDTGTHVIESVLNQILTEMDGLEDLKDVVVMGATNRPDIIDPALLRAGRFDRLVYVGEPNLDARREIFEIHTRGKPIEGSAMRELLIITKGFSESDIESVINRLGEYREISVDEIKKATLAIEKPTLGGLPDHDLQIAITEALRNRCLELRDPKMEDLLRIVENFDAPKIEEFVAKMAKNKSFTLEDAKAAAEEVVASVGSQDTDQEEPSQLSKLKKRRILEKKFGEGHITLGGSETERLLEVISGFGGNEIEILVERLGRNRIFNLGDAIVATKAIKGSIDGGLKDFERRHFIDKDLSSHNLSLEDPAREKILADLAKVSEGFVGSDIEAICREAGMAVLRVQLDAEEDARKKGLPLDSFVPRESVIKKADFEAAIAKVRPTMNENVRTQYSKIQQHFKGGLPKEAQPPEYQ